MDTIGSLIERGEPIEYVPDLEPKREKFVGFHNQDYAEIRYELEFPGAQADIGCGEYISGDTTGNDLVDVSGTGPNRGPVDPVAGGHMFESFRQHFGVAGFKIDRRRLVMTSPGNVTFDMCDSKDGNMVLGVKIQNSTQPLDINDRRHDVIVAGDGLPDHMAPLFGWPLANFTKKPYGVFHHLMTGGCPMSTKVLRTVSIEMPGEYIIEIHGHPGSTDEGGLYLLGVSCQDGAESLAGVSDAPGRIQVDAVTGRIFGKPVRTGNFTMNLVARDKARRRTQVRSWNLTVVDPPGSNYSSPAWDPYVDATGTVGVLADYAVEDTVYIRSPELDNAELFIHPAQDEFDNIRFFYTVEPHGQYDGVDSAPCASKDTLTDAFTGKGAFRFPQTCTGSYRATLVGRDGAGVEKKNRSAVGLPGPHDGRRCPKLRTWRCRLPSWQPGRRRTLRSQLQVRLLWYRFFRRSVPIGRGDIISVIRRGH